MTFRMERNSRNSRIFINTEFEGGRHERRINKIFVVKKNING